MDMLAMANLDGYFTSVNPAWEVTLGYTRKELLGRHYLDFIHPDDVARTLDRAAALFDTKQKTRRFENRYRAKDGKCRWLAWRARAASDQSSIYCVVRDVTEAHAIMTSFTTCWIGCASASSSSTVPLQTTFRSFM